MRTKMRFPQTHLENFPEILPAVSNEQVKSFHYDLKVMEERNQGTWQLRMVTDYYWSIKSGLTEVEPTGKSYRRRSWL